MSTRTPSYLYLRGGIYYFQLRIPKAKLSPHATGMRLLRQSTGTGNRAEALRIAKTLWVKHMSKNTPADIAFPKTFDDMDAEMEYRDQLYRHGRILDEALRKCDSNDNQEIDEVFLYYGKDANFDSLALRYYSQFQEHAHTDKHQPSLNNDISAPKKRLSHICEEYIAQKMNQKEPWTTKTRDKYESIIKLMIEMVGDPFTQDLTIDLISKKYSQKIHLLPASIHNRKDLYYSSGKRRAVDDIIKIAKDKKQKTLSNSTLSDNSRRVSSFLVWASTRNLIPQGLHLALEEYKKASKSEKIDAKPFSDQDLIKLFHSDDYTKGIWLHKKPERHWVPLLGLYTGARLGEIAKLKLNDILQEEDTMIWHINIRDEGDDGRLKTASSKRQVPIPDTLVKLGFIKYTESLKKSGETQLFPKLKPSKKYSNWGKNITYWFPKHMEKCGVTKGDNERKSFHSFRHTFLNHQKQKMLNADIVSEIVGHAHKNEIRANYQEGFPLKIKHEEINKFMFCIDHNLIKRWQ